MKLVINHWKILALLTLLSSQIFANSEQVNIKVSGVDITFNAPVGFCSTKKISPDFFNFHSKFSTSPKSKLHAYLVSDQDCTALMNNSDPELREHISIKTSKDLEGMNISQEDFDQFKFLVIKKYKNMLKSLNSDSERIKRDIEKHVNTGLDVKFEMMDYKVLPIGIHVDRQYAIGYSMILKVGSDQSSDFVVISTTHHLVKGKILLSIVYSTSKTTKDIVTTKDRAVELAVLLAK